MTPLQYPLDDNKLGSGERNTENTFAKIFVAKQHNELTIDQKAREHRENSQLYCVRLDSYTHKVHTEGIIVGPNDKFQAPTQSQLEELKKALESCERLENDLLINSSVKLSIIQEINLFGPNTAKDREQSNTKIAI